MPDQDDTAAIPLRKRTSLARWSARNVNGAHPSRTRPVEHESGRGSVVEGNWHQLEYVEREVAFTFAEVWVADGESFGRTEVPGFND